MTEENTGNSHLQQKNCLRKKTPTTESTGMSEEKDNQTQNQIIVKSISYFVFC